MFLSRQFVLLMCLGFLLGLFVHAGKDKPRKTRASLSAQNDYHAKSLQDWKSMSTEALQLACNTLHISSSGARCTIATRLYRFFHPPSSVINNNNTVSDLAVNVVEQAEFQPLSSASDVGPSQSGGNELSILHSQPDIASVVRLEVQRALANFAFSSSPSPPVVATSTRPESVHQHPPHQTSSATLDSRPYNIVGNEHLTSNQASASSSSADVILPDTVARMLSNQGRASQASINTSAMPPLPQTVIDKIKNCEFVNFDLLLPNRSPIQNDEYTFKVVGGATPSVALVPNNQKKPKVTDFNSWMVAWNKFIRCYSIFHPHRVQELIRYQTIICDFASQYNFAAWSQYDQMFRYQLAYNHDLSWYRIDDDLYNRYIRGATLRDLCYLCRSFGHFASACPNRAGASSSQGPLPPFRASQRRSDTFARGSEQSTSGRICQFYNRGQCTNERCRFTHQCVVCQGAHPAFRCPKRTSNS